MRFGSAETVAEARARGLKALKYLAAQTQQPQVAQQPKPQAEDPLVGLILGPATGGSMAGGAQDFGPQHPGFVCDVTGESPIVGVRFKATSAKDFDITKAARYQGRFPTGGAGWRSVPNLATALRWGLGAVLAWWPVLWQDRTDLFAHTPPDLSVLTVNALAAAVLNLPQDRCRYRDPTPGPTVVF